MPFLSFFNNKYQPLTEDNTAQRHKQQERGFNQHDSSISLNLGLLGSLWKHSTLKHVFKKCLESQAANSDMHIRKKSKGPISLHCLIENLPEYDIKITNKITSTVNKNLTMLEKYSFEYYLGQGEGDWDERRISYIVTIKDKSAKMEHTLEFYFNSAYLPASHHSHTLRQVTSLLLDDKKTHIDPTTYEAISKRLGQIVVSIYPDIKQIEDFVEHEKKVVDTRQLSY